MRPSVLDAAALDRFRPLLRFEPSPAVSWMYIGCHELFLQLDRPGRPFHCQLRFPDRSTRMQFRWVESLEGYAVDGIEALPEGLQSDNWRKAAAWCREFPRLEPEARARLLALLNTAGLPGDVKRLCERFPALVAPSRWDEAQAQCAYQRARMRSILGGLCGDHSELFEIAERSPRATVVRFSAALRFATLELQRGSFDAGARRGLEIARKTLRELEGALDPAYHKVLEATYWRTLSYRGFLARDQRDMDRAQERARSLSEAALATAGPEFVHHARECWYAFCQTRSVSTTALGRTREAIRWLETMRDFDPGGAWQRLWLGTALFRAGEVERAHGELLAAYRLAPPYVERSCAWLARCERALGRPERAAPWERLSRRMSEADGASQGEPPAPKAVPIAPRPARGPAPRLRKRARRGAIGPRAAIARSRARLLAGDLRGGWEDLLRAAEREPAELAIPRDATTARCIQRLDAAVIRAPRAAAAWAWRGLLRARMGDASGAIFDISRARELKLKTPLALLWLAELRLRRYDRACLRDALAFLRRVPGSPAGEALLSRAAWAFFNASMTESPLAALLRYETLYRQSEPGKLGWDAGAPDEELVRLVESGEARRGRALDLGCGRGHDAAFLARNGFTVTAIDISPSALAAARKQASGQGAAASIRFLCMDALDLRPRRSPYDLVCDRGFFHGLSNDDRERYLPLVAGALRPGGLLFLRVVKAGETAASDLPPPLKEEELRSFFAPRFDAVWIKDGVFAGGGRHAAHACLLRLKRPPAGRAERG